MTREEIGNWFSVQQLCVMTFLHINIEELVPYTCTNSGMVTVGGGNDKAGGL